MIERIAQRIGMERMEYDCEVFWADADGGCEAADLPAYLATGDRPLRIVEAYTIGLVPAESGGWIALDHSAERRLQTTQMSLHPTPVEAILALAEKIEGGE